MRQFLKTFQIIFVVLIIVFAAACNGQNKPVVPNQNTTQAKKTETKSTDIDPYFTPPKALTFFSPYGPTSITRNILEDNKGNIWLATWEGIIQYRDEVFTNFTTKDGLRKFHVFCIFEDSSGYIWFGTIGAGIYRYDPTAETGEKAFTNFTTKNGLASDQVTCIYEDKAGKVWFGTDDGISIYDPSISIKSEMISFQNLTTKNGLTDNDINSIIEDENGKFWFGTRGAACFYDPATSIPDVMNFTTLMTDDSSSFTNVRSIIEDKNGNIWLGGNNGFWRYDGSSFSQHTTDFIGYIFEDKKGNIWTSSEINGNPGHWGITRYNEEFLQKKYVLPIQIIAENGMFFGITEDKKGGIWFGSLEGVYRYDPVASLTEDKSIVNRFKK